MKIKNSFFIFMSLFLLLSACKAKDSKTNEYLPSEQQSELEHLLINSATPKYEYDVVATYPHPLHSFTEGLLFDNGMLYESVGLYSESALRKIDIQTNKIILQHVMPPRYFAEGIAILGKQIYQLTYLEKTAFVYDKNNFSLQKTYHYSGEGWGLTADNKQLIMSNGSAVLSFINPKTFKSVRQLLVMDKQHHPINYLNELEYINGRIYANVWPTDIIVIISPQSGVVEGWINLHSLHPSLDCLTATDCAANGIAYHHQDASVWVTGKNWPSLYAIKLRPSAT